MPNPRSPYVVSGKLSSGAAKVQVLNVSNGDKISVDVNSSGEFAFDLADSDWTNDYVNGQKLQITVQGALIGTASHTINTSVGASSVTITTDTDAQPTLVI